MKFLRYGICDMKWIFMKIEIGIKWWVCLFIDDFDDKLVLI